MVDKGHGKVYHPSMDDPDATPILDMMDKAARELLEHSDCVLILVSGPATDKEGGTNFYRTQRGNLHACEGVAHEYLRRLHAYEGGYYGENGRRDCEHNHNGFE